ncbi:hypothetical protein, partial [Caenimonas koreensis]|uniref:hypothetical protein n=1 Tax=Caenimonas koreensis TaxID=367474 RepID=UPI00188FB150
NLPQRLQLEFERVPRPRLLTHLSFLLAKLHLSKESVFRGQGQSDLQFADLKNRLRKFPKTPFDMFAGSSSSVEVNELVARVASALEDAGWIWKPSKNGDFALSIPGKPEVALLVSTGIHIEIAESQRGALEGAAVALRDGLVANGLKVSAVIIPDAEIRPNFDKSCIHVVIGGKQ